MKYSLALTTLIVIMLCAVATASFGQSLTMEWGTDWRRMSKAQCATKAVEAMGVKENFILAETNASGDVFGYSENVAALVYSVPLRDGVEIYVVVAGKDAGEAGRLRNSIRTQVFDGPYNAAIPARIATRDARRRSSAPAFQLGSDSRPMSRSDFAACAVPSMSRQGMAASVNQAGTVSGSNAVASMAAFYLELRPGTGYISVVAASFNSTEAERLRNVVRADIFNKNLPKPWAVILCKFNDKPAFEPHPASFYRERFTEAGAGQGTEFDYFRQVSYGAVDMTGTKVFGWLPMPSHSTRELAALKYPARGRNTIANWGIDVAKANRIDLSAFYGVMVVFNSQTDSGASGSHQVVFGYNGADWSPTFNFHEIGHGFDLNHSWSARPDVEYGDRWDIMSAMNVYTFNNSLGQGTGPGMNAFNLKQLGAITAPRIWTVANGRSSATVTLAALNRPEAGGYLMASVPPAVGSALKTAYIVEFRQKRGWDAGIPADTVLVHEVRENGTCYLLSRIERTDAGAVEVLAGQQFSVPERSLTVSVSSFDSAAGTAKVTISTGK